MSRSLYTAAPTEGASAVREEMHRRHIRHVPVVAEGRVLGVLSLRDLLRHDLQVKTRRSRRSPRTSRAACPRTTRRRR
ncbi:MAG: CBS domain-containing protein [Planctomycetes bacterium]|nr:CBS domain-containing protein [Planctomycetota bacterium]